MALLDAALTPPAVPVLYMTLTRANAKEIIWGDLLALNERYGLGGEVNLTDLTMTMPTGVPIQLRGANSERELAKVRGKKFKLAIVDEAQSFPDRILDPLMRRDLGPTLRDYGGSQWLCGTVPPVQAGYFWETYAGKLAVTREQHRWTLRENERFPRYAMGLTYEQVVAEVLQENGWTADDPTFRREYLNEEIEDTDALLFTFADGLNTCGELPEGKWSYVMGVDLGYEDSDAVAVLGWRAHDATLYLVEEYVQAQEDVTDLALVLKDLVDRYKPMRVVIDEGGGGKKAAAEMRARWKLPLEPAEKAQKPAYIRLLNADLRKGKLLARPDSRFREDCRLVTKDPVALMRGLLQERPVANGGYHSDIVDAVLYGWRAALHFRQQPAPAPVPEPDAMRAARARLIAKRPDETFLEADLRRWGL